MSFPTIFFDRDNTLNVDPGYLSNPNVVELFDGVGEGISRLKNSCGFKIVVISNQSGIARGFFSKIEVDSVNEKINQILLDKNNVKIDAFYYCPFHPDFSSAEESECRKPSPMLVLKAAEEMDLDLSKSYFVGDKPSDIECGINAGLKTVLINYEKEKIDFVEKYKPNFIVDNFLNACDFIIADYTGGKTFVE
ncbi:MAG: HAD family hydrolase [Melioribacteraceae bacterium]|nr:HAD family hydrolase [Melioribacteraceae bacterium]